jgi:hypothetical protein
MKGRVLLSFTGNHRLRGLRGLREDLEDLEETLRGHHRNMRLVPGCCKDQWAATD